MNEDELKIKVKYVKEAQKLGFSEVICSYKTEDFDKNEKIRLRKIKSIREILGILNK